ncbi:MAG: hypothetical protein PHP92_05535 [Candidatus Nanoarchaeia archaeon]|nr:hypothetical protein [Candidatus Nanoarchaeia archaeon]
METKLAELKAADPDIFAYPDILLTKIFVDYEPTDTDGYISILNIGETKIDTFLVRRYAVNTKIVLKNTEYLNMGLFSDLCRGISNELFKTINEDIDDFHVGAVNVLAYTPRQLYEQQFLAEIVANIDIDIATISADILSLE